MIQPAYTYSANLIRVIDGDTVILDLDLGMREWRRGEPCRLYGINTPEIRSSDPQVASLALQARDYLIDVLGHASAIVARTYKAHEKYGRWLVDLYADGLFVNQELVRLGLAEPLKYGGAT